MNSEQTTDDRLMSLSVVADSLDISIRQVWRMIAQGELPKPVKIGRSSKMFASDIDKYMDRLKKQRK